MQAVLHTLIFAQGKSRRPNGRLRKRRTTVTPGKSDRSSQDSADRLLQILFRRVLLLSPDYAYAKQGLDICKVGKP